MAARGTDTEFVKVALQVEPRSLLHERIALRLGQMLEAGFLDELRGLMQRPGLDRDSPAMRSVGYRQFWAYLAGECSLEEASAAALAATRQLAKRQITWLRSETALRGFDALDSRATDAISAYLARELA
jgi:tRNA dimethylallyltransferase